MILPDAVQILQKFPFISAKKLFGSFMISSYASGRMGSLFSFVSV